MIPIAPAIFYRFIAKIQTVSSDRLDSTLPG
jgi:hypothetical protein